MCNFINIICFYNLPLHRHEQLVLREKTQQRYGSFKYGTNQKREKYVIKHKFLFLTYCLSNS